MRYLLITVFLLSLLSSHAGAQNEAKSFGLSLSGYVKTDLIYDSRQTSNLREGHFLLYPLAESLGADGEDLNAAPSFNMLSIQTRLKGDITGPDALGAKTSGQIEGEFFGMAEGDINGFRLRHAFVRMDWGATSLLVGQTWHPMFVSEVFPGVVSFNTGAPFQPFSRNPQIRFSHALGGLRLIAAAVSQRDFQSYGPDAAGKPVLSSSFLRNAVIPNLHFQAQYGVDGHVFGAGVDYKQLLPRLVTDKNTAAEERVSGTSLIGYAKIDVAPLSFKVEGVLGENLADLLQLGGYAITAVDAESGEMEYSPLGSFSVWGEVIYGKEFEVALFAGYSESLGADDNILGGYYTRGGSIANLLRVSPRVQYSTGKVRFSAEFEYTAAAFGTPNDANKGQVENTVSVANSRMLMAVYYFF